MLEITPQKAEILGLLCAEGSHYIYISEYDEYQPKRHRSFHRTVLKERIEFTNTNVKLLKHFQNLVNKVYNYLPKCRKILSCYKIAIIKKDVMNDILKYTDFGHLKWKVPKEVIKGNKLVKSAFVRGFFYGDGSYTHKPKRITLWSINYRSLKQISNILNEFGIKHHIYSYKSKKPRRNIIFNIAIYKKRMIDKFICTFLNTAEVTEILDRNQVKCQPAKLVGESP